MKPFQVVFLAIFIGAFVGSIILFAVFGGVSKDTSVTIPTTIIWGTLKADDITPVFDKMNFDQSKSIDARYVQKSEETFDLDLLKAIADGTPPDLVILPASDMWNKHDRLYTIPYSAYPERYFKDTYIQAADILHTASGYLGVPFSIDPMVMYWNRNLLGQAGISQVPTNWDDVVKDIPKLSKVDQTLGISQSAIALGEFRNVNKSKEILSSLLFQAGNSITTLTTSLVDNQDTYQINLGIQDGYPEKAILFYNQFSDPNKITYNWNRSLQSSTDAFLAEKLALYLGSASELSQLQNRNPNLNFDVAAFPQSKTSINSVVYGKLYAVGILKNSKNMAGASDIMNKLTGATFQKNYTEKVNLPPIRRDLLATAPSNGFAAVFYQAALIAKTWFDPSDARTTTIFGNMVESVSSGKNGVTDALREASDEMKSLIR